MLQMEAVASRDEAYIPDLPRSVTEESVTNPEIVNLILSVVGIVVSAAGFVITVVQVRKARSTIEAAESATKTAIGNLSARLTIFEIADMRGAIRGVQTALRGERYETALLQLQVIIDQLHALRSRPQFENDVRHAAIQEIVVQLAKLRNRLELKTATPTTPLSVPSANNLLAELGSTMIGWSEELRFTTNEEES